MNMITSYNITSNHNNVNSDTMTIYNIIRNYNDINIRTIIS